MGERFIAKYHETLFKQDVIGCLEEREKNGKRNFGNRIIRTIFLVPILTLFSV